MFKTVDEKLDQLLKCLTKEDVEFLVQIISKKIKKLKMKENK